jgi:hypothetical protein
MIILFMVRSRIEVTMAKSVRSTIVMVVTLNLNFAVPLDLNLVATLMDHHVLAR